MKKVLSAVLAYLMLHTGALGLTPPKEAEPASHIYFVNDEGAVSGLGFIRSREKMEFSEVELVADFEGATAYPEVVWISGTDYIIRDDKYYMYSPLTNEKRVINRLDVEKDDVRPLYVQTERTENGRSMFQSDDFIVVRNKENGKEGVFNLVFEHYFMHQEYTDISAVSTDSSMGTEYVYGRFKRQVEEDGSSYEEDASIIYRVSTYDIYYCGVVLNYINSMVSDGKIVFYDPNGSDTLISTAGTVLQLDEMYDNCCLLPDGNIILSGGKQFYVYDTDLNLVHESKVYNSTNEVISTKGIVEEHGYSDYNYITVVKDAVLMLTDAYETFSAPVCRLGEKMPIVRSSSFVTAETLTLKEGIVTGYEVQTDVDEDGLPVFTEADIPETVPAGVYFFFNNNNVPEDTAGRGIMYGYDTAKGVYIRLMTSGGDSIFE